MTRAERPSAVVDTLIALLIEKHVFSAAELAAQLAHTSAAGFANGIVSAAKAAGRNAQLAAELDEARETILQFHRAMNEKGHAIYRGLSFNWAENVVLNTLIETPGLCQREWILNRLDLMSRHGTQHSLEYLAVILVRLRAKLRKVDVLIDGYYGEGLALSRQSIAKLEHLRT